MEFTIDKQHDFTWLNVKVPAGKKLFSEAGAMASMSTDIQMKSKFKGALTRFLTNESLFLTEYSARQVDGQVQLAPPMLGDVGHIKLQGERFYLASTSYLAHSEGIDYSSKFQKLSQGFIGGMGWFLSEMSGTGDVWFHSYGALQELDVQDDVVIDNGHIVGFTEGVNYEITKIGGYKSLLFSGEGFVCRFSGQGKVYFQSKKPTALLHWADGFRRVVQKQN